MKKLLAALVLALGLAAIVNADVVCVGSVCPAPTPTAAPTPVSYPLSLTNGGLGVNMSSPNPLLKQSKDMGTGGANGGFTATAFVQVAVAAGGSAYGEVKFNLTTSDGTRVNNQVGRMVFACSQEGSGGLMTTASSTNAASGLSFTGVTSTAGSLAESSLVFTSATGVGFCELRVAVAVTTGTATSNTLYWEVWPLGTGTWSAR